MGFFDKMKNDMMKNMAGNMPQMPQTPGAGQAAAPPDANDPLMQPIEDITIEKFAEISGKMSKEGRMPLEKVTPFVEANGVKPGTWTTVQSGWMGRIQGNPQLQAYYSSLFAKYMK